MSARLAARQERHRAGGDQLAQLGQRSSALRIAELGAVVIGELVEAVGVVPVPLAQLGGRGDVLAPLVEVGTILTQPTRRKP
ncbi:MAG: hypothetical protein QM733_00925 [Ilumatobacteraceae bacterium]